MKSVRGLRIESDTAKGWVRWSCVLLLAAVPILSAQPRITFDHEGVFDFGSLYQGEVGEFRFAFKNTGFDTLVVDHVEATCGCTVALLSSRFVPPSGTGMISTVLSTDGLLGPVRKHVLVRSNDPAHPEFELEIRGNVLVEIDLDRAEINFTRARIGATAEASVVMENVSDRAVALVDVDNPYRWLSMTLGKVTLRPGERYTLNVSATPVEPGQRSGTFAIKTDSQRQRAVLIKFFIDVPAVPSH